MARGRHAAVPRSPLYSPLTEFIRGPRELPEHQAYNQYQQDYPLTISQAAEYIHCSLCNDTVAVIRHQPRAPLQFSTYHPQPPRSCRCKNLHAMVDHRGMPRIYTDHPETISFRVPFKTQGHWLGHNNLLDYPQLSISQLLLDGPKPQRSYEPPKLDPLLLYTDTLEIINYDDLRLPPVGFSRKLTPQERYCFYRQYAYTYKIIIRTPKMVYYPNGLTLHPNKPRPANIITCTYLNIEINMLHLHHRRGNPTVTSGYPYNVASPSLNHYIHRRNHWMQRYYAAYKLNPQAAIRSLEHLHIIRIDHNESIIPPIPIKILIASDKLTLRSNPPKYSGPGRPKRQG
jgi:hypothetical protein